MHERPCHYTAKRGSDADASGTEARRVRENFGGAPECRADYGVNHAGLRRDLSVTRTRPLPILGAPNWIHPWPLRHSGKQGTIGSCNGASVKAAIHLPLQINPQGLFICAGIRLPFFSRAPCPALPLAIALPCSSSIHRGIAPLTSKEVFDHTQRTPVIGHVGLRRAIPQLRKASVAFDQALSGRLGVVSHDRPA